MKRPRLRSMNQHHITPKRLPISSLHCLGLSCSALVFAYSAVALALTLRQWVLLELLIKQGAGLSSPGISVAKTVLEHERQKRLSAQNRIPPGHVSAPLDSQSLEKHEKSLKSLGISTRTTTNIRNESQPRPMKRKESAGWRLVSIVGYGAIGDNITDNTAAFHAALTEIRNSGGGEVLVPKGGIFQTAPFNLSSNMVLRVDGTIFGIPNQDKYPAIGILPSYVRDYDFKAFSRRHPLVNAVHQQNITITGQGTIDGAGWYWYPCFTNHTRCHNIGRPHLMELQNCTNVEITGVRLKNSAFWTLHPVYCTDVHIHHMSIEAPHCRLYKCPNTDGIDVDSCQNVLIEHNTINVGDDHVTVIAGRRRGSPKSKVCRNVTVRHNTLLSGMGLSVGSSTAGGVEDVLYHNNIMRETKGQLGQGLHIKTRTRFGGYVKNIAWIDNVFYMAGKPGGAIRIEAGYQSGKADCDKNRCTQVSNILIRNLTVHDGNAGFISCYENKPCVNITLENVRFFNSDAGNIGCDHVVSGSASHLLPPSLLDGCPGIVRGEGVDKMINLTNVKAVK